MTTFNPRIEKRFDAVSSSRTFRNLRNAFNLENKSVLDIGCSYGEFLIHFGKGSVGITATPNEVSYAESVHNLNVLEGNIEDTIFISSISQKFDVIFANNIFEHLYTPHSFLIKIKKLLKKDGVLILGVPCVPKLTTLMHFKKFRGSLADSHINFFTSNTLRLTVERAGWFVEQVRSFKYTIPFTDHILDSISPHLYVVARADDSFEYSDKRKKELRGYAEHTPEIPVKLIK